MTNEGLSLVDVAEIILKEAKEPLNIYDIFDAVCVRKGLAANVKDVVVSQFYADITVSAKFVYVGENTWDLKDNQKINIYNKLIIFIYCYYLSYFLYYFVCFFRIIISRTTHGFYNNLIILVTF